MRLIDADALKSIKSIQSANYNTIEAIQKWIDEAPTIVEFDNPITSVKVRDVEYVPVRHGRWKHERLPSTSGGSYAVVRCSMCGYQYPMAETRYCPNCGAKMDEEIK